jgi:hypothetical protein
VPQKSPKQRRQSEAPGENVHGIMRIKEREGKYRRLLTTGGFVVCVIDQRIIAKLEITSVEHVVRNTSHSESNTRNVLVPRIE